MAQEVPASYREKGVSCGKAGVRTATQAVPSRLSGPDKSFSQGLRCAPLPGTMKVWGLHLRAMTAALQAGDPCSTCGIYLYIQATSTYLTLKPP